MNKVLVAVLTAEHSPYLKRIQACRETWIQHAPDWATVWIISGPKLGVPDEYDKMSYKLQALAKRALGASGWEWLLRIDDDVCVNWNNVVIPTSGDYIGLEVPPRPDSKYPYAAGAVQWLSRAAVEVIAKMKSAKGVIEDLEIGRIMDLAGIKPIFVPYIYTVVRRPNQEAEIDELAVQAIRNQAFVLETGSPENMRKLHAVLGLGPKAASASSAVAAMKPGEVPPSVVSGSVYRDLQGNYVKRGATVFNAVTPQPNTAGAIARPDTDPGWRDDIKNRILKQNG